MILCERGAKVGSHARPKKGKPRARVGAPANLLLTKLRHHFKIIKRIKNSPVDTARGRKALH
jgi:hypothetical protein